MTRARSVVDAEGTEFPMTEAQAWGDDVYQPDGSEVQDDAGVLDYEDTLEGPVGDPLDGGYSPPERPLGAEHTGRPRPNGTMANPSTSALRRRSPSSPPPTATASETRRTPTGSSGTTRSAAGGRAA